MDKDEYINQLIVKSCSVPLNLQEEKDLQEWLAESEDHQDEYLKILAYMHAKVMVPVNHLKIDKTCDHIFHKGRNRRFLLSAISFAAVLFIGVIVGWSLSDIGLNRSVVQYVAGTTPSEFLLPDNSKVILNAHSTLTYDHRFGEKDRTVSLIGEGFFKVKSDYEKEFIVNMGAAQIHVLGTEFNARNLPEESEIIASLVSGSILFTTENQKLKIKPETSVIFNKEDEKMSLEHFSADTLTAWTQNLFRFKSQKLDKVIGKIAADKGVEIEMRYPEFMDVAISCTVERGLSFEQILNILAIRKNFTWSISGDTFIIEGKRNID